MDSIFRNFQCLRDFLETDLKELLPFARHFRFLRLVIGLQPRLARLSELGVERRRRIVLEGGGIPVGIFF